MARLGANRIRFGAVYSYAEEDKPEYQKHIFRTAQNIINVTFNQDNPASPYAGLDVGVPIDLRAEYPIGTIWRRFYGEITDISLDAGRDPTVTLTVADLLEKLARVQLTTLAVPVGDGERTGARVNRILDAAGHPSTLRAVDTGYSTAAGEIRSRGFEFDFAGQLTTNWRLNASLVLNDVEITKDNTLAIGGRLLNVPRVNGSVLAVYENAFANGQRYGIGGGVTHVGKRLGQARTQADASAATPSFELPSYTTAKLIAYWRINPALRVTLDIDNLFDSTYYASSYSRLWVTPGTARTITVGLQAKF